MKLKWLGVIALVSLAPTWASAAEQANAASVTGETGLFNLLTGDTLPQGGWSFGLYYNTGRLVDFPDVFSSTTRAAQPDHNRLSARLARTHRRGRSPWSPTGFKFDRTTSVRSVSPAWATSRRHEVPLLAPGAMRRRGPNASSAPRPRRDVASDDLGRRRPEWGSQVRDHVAFGTRDFDGPDPAATASRTRPSPPASATLAGSPRRSTGSPKSTASSTTATTLSSRISTT